MSTMLSKHNGLSAGAETIGNVKVASYFNDLVKSVAEWTLLLLFMLVMFSCNENIKGQNLADQKNDHTAIKEDSLNKPMVNIKVNKRYDEKGNLIGFDSTYSSYYTNVAGDTSMMDSLFDRFGLYFKRKYPSFFEKEFNTLFFNDSLHYPDFFHHDFFQKRYELNDVYFKDIMKKMDSIKNYFYHEQGRRRESSSDL